MTENQFKEIMISLKDKISKANTILSNEILYNTGNKHLHSLQNQLKDTEIKCNSQNFKIAVLALIKAGKSTFINALLGNEFLPSNAFPETSRIVRIIHSQEIKLQDTANENIVILGLDNIREYVRKLNVDAREKNIQPIEDELILYAPIFKLKDERLNGVSFEILDTPGPNEAGADKLRERVESLLSKIDVIVYLLDYTRLNQQAEKELLEKINDLRQDLLESIKNRMFFVVNKIDAKTEHSPNEKETIEFVYSNISKSIPTITKDKVLVVSSEYALLSRMLLSNNFNRKKDFAKILYGLKGLNKTNEECINDCGELLKDSFIEDVENKVISHIYSNRSAIFLDTIVSELLSITKNLQNYFKTAYGTLNQDVEQLTTDLEQIQKEVATAKKNLEAINQLADEFKTNTQKWIRTNFTEFRESVESIINQAFNEPNKFDFDEYSNKSNVAIDIASLAGNFVSSIIEIFNPVVGRFLKKLLKRSKSAIVNLKDIVGKLKILKSSQSKADLEITIRQLNENIISFLSASFTSFRDDLEYDALKKQKELFSKFEEIINSSRKQIEDKIGKQLNIVLEETPITFPVDSMSSLHDNINSFIKKHEKQRTEKIDGGWCRKDEYRTITDVLFSVDKHDIKKYWLEEIDKMNRLSLITAEKLVNENIGVVLAKAQKTFVEYAENYISIIEREFQEKQKGNVQCEKRLAEINANLEMLERVKNELLEIKKSV